MKRSRLATQMAIAAIAAVMPPVPPQHRHIYNAREVAEMEHGRIKRDLAEERRERRRVAREENRRRSIEGMGLKLKI